MPMKVVVCFDSVRVTVPCGEGEILVRELINKAVHRYKRAVGKGTDHWVEVNSLKTISGGGILDPDDQLSDVVDDREQLIAEFEEQNRPTPASLPSSLHHQHHNGGDGASASSTGTTSPEPFSHLPLHHHHQQHHLPFPLTHHSPGDSLSSSSSANTAPPLPSVPPPLPTVCPPSQQNPTDPLTNSSVVVVVGGAGADGEDGGRRDDGGGSARRDSSSSNSNNAVTDVVVTPRDLSMGTTLRVRRGSEPSLATLLDSTSSEKQPVSPGNLRPLLPRRESVRDSDEPRSESSDEEKLMWLPMTNSLDRKKIGLARFQRDSLRSSLSSRPEMYRWLEAQQKAEQKTKAPKVEGRKGPVEGHDGEDVNNTAPQNECLVRLQNDGGPLGIHAIPAHDESGMDTGLLIQSIEQGRPVHRDGRIQPKDIIVEINGTSLQGVPFIKAQEVFRAAMDTHEICLKVVKGDEEARPDPPVPELPAKRKPAHPQPPPVMPKPRNHAPFRPSPLATSPPVPAPRDLNKSAPDAQFPAVSTSVNSTGPQGLNIAHSNVAHTTDTSCGSAPVSTTSVSTSAIATGAGGETPDLLSSSSPMSSKKSMAAVSPAIKPGPPIKAPKKSSAVPALPARIPSVSAPTTPHSPTLPSAIPPPSQATTTPTTTDIASNAVFNTRRIGKKLVIRLRKGPLGLGFSVTSRDNQTGGDCPIYIRNILPRGAAVQDGQLRPGDRLLQVNGVEMTGKTQAEAVSFLRTLQEGSLVELVVSRQEEVDEKFKVPRKMNESSGLDSVEPLSGTSESQQGLEPENPDDPKADHNDDDVDEEECPRTVLPQQPSKSLDSIDGGAVSSGKEKITLRIPLNDTGSAGLGVSVKGKTQSSQAGLQDLGIFVKTVLQGGAAYKDGRLRVNDQLLEVNGVDLEDQPNTAAMDALRTAMMEEGVGSGFITLSVLRHAPNAPLSPSQPAGFSDNAEDSCAPAASNNVMNYYSYQQHVQPSVGFPGASGVPIIHHRSSSASDALSSSMFNGDSAEMPSPIPPARTKRVAALRERFQSEGNALRNDSYNQATNESLSLSPVRGSNGLRNESYARATQDSLNDSGAFTQVLPSQPKWSHPIGGKQQDSKENIPVQDQDPYAHLNKQQRPHSSIGFLHGPRLSHNSSDGDAFVRDSVASSKDDSDLSPSMDLVTPFAREGFGRQSMSEKRKGHLDPRSTETYKMVKASKENKENKGNTASTAKDVGATSPPPQQPTGHVIQHQQASPSPPPLQPVLASTDPTPTSSQALKPNTLHENAQSTYHPSRSAADMASNMKKSSSVEDLSNPGQNAVSSSSSGTNQNRDASPMWRHTRFGRTRACNDSFRAAVDRSYDALDPALMDTLEEESAESGAFTLDPSNSGRSSISSENPEDSNSLQRRKAKDKEKKGGLLKGFLRFGKGRKSNEEAMRRSRSEERPTDRALVERRQDQSTDRPSNNDDDLWTEQPFGDAKTVGFAHVPEPEQQPQQRGRRLSKPDQERIDEEYARLRDYHVSQQRLRSQSVDPSSQRHASSSSSVSQPSSAWERERSSPFQPYSSSVPSNPMRHPSQGFYPGEQHESYDREKERHHFPHQALYRGEQQDKGGYAEERETDPRRFHPAALDHRQENRDGRDRRANKQYFPEMDQDKGRPPLAKAVLSRAEYIQQLRSLYQQRHKQRQGIYPLDDTEEKYERQIQEMERRDIPFNSESLNDASRDLHLLRFTDRPPSRQIEQHRSERTLSSSSMGNSNNNLNSTYAGDGRQVNYSHYQHHQNDYNAPMTLPLNRLHSRGATATHESGISSSSSSSYYRQNVQLHGNYHHHHHYHPLQQQQQPYHLQGYDYSHHPNYRDYSNPDNNGSASYRRTAYEPYAQDQFYGGAPQAYRSAPGQYPQHRATTPYSDPTSAKV